MSTSAISSSSIYQELQTFYQTRQSDLQTLGSALQSGDLNAAQQAYGQLVSLGQSGPFGSTQPFQRSDRASDFAAIGKALSSGDLAGAQAAFAKLQQTFGQSNSSSAAGSPAYKVNLSTASTGSLNTNLTSGSSSSSSSGSTGGLSTGSTSGTSGTSGTESIYQQLQDFRSARKSDLQQLGQALSSGDLATAEQDYQNLVTLGQQGPFASGGAFQRSDRAQDFQAIGEALQSGSVTSAQQAYATLESTFGQQSSPVNQGGGPPIHTASGGSGSGAVGISEIVINIGGTGSSTPQSSNGSELVVNLPAPTSTGSPEEVQINFPGASGSSGQLTVEVGQTQDQSGRLGEQVTINLAQANNSENIVLNLFGAGSSTQSQTQGSSLNVQG